MPTSSQALELPIKLSGNRSNQLIANLRLQVVYDMLYRYLLEIALDRVPIVRAVRLESASSSFATIPA